MGISGYRSTGEEKKLVAGCGCLVIIWIVGALILQFGWNTFIVPWLGFSPMPFWVALGLAAVIALLK